MPSGHWLGKVLRYPKRVVAAYRRIQESQRTPENQRISENQGLLLQQRHRDVIERTEQLMRLNDRQTHYIDDLTAQCLRDIAIKEGQSGAAPRVGEWLSQWRRRAEFHREYVELAQYLRGRFQNRCAELRQEAQRTEQLAKERRYKEYEQWLLRHRLLVGKFLEVADRKVSTLDEYGDENWEALPKEIRTFLLKIAKTEDDNGKTESALREAWKKGYDWMVPEKYEWLTICLETGFRKFHNQRGRSTSEPEFDELSGVEFETYLAGLLKRNGFESIRGTPATGDQGADLLATKANQTIAIQAKRYRGSVGNKAVQEVVAAVKFYRADESWVITNGTFTASAKALAQAYNVRLIDGYGLRNGSVGK
jgi:Restriction endonuclease